MEEKIEDMIYRDPWHFRPHRKSKSGRQVFESHPYPLPSLSLDYEMKVIAIRECGSVVCIHFRSDGGGTFSRSGFVMESTLSDGEYFNTIFTADCISRDNKNANVVAAPSDIEISVVLSDGTTCIGELVGYDLYYNIAAIKMKTQMLIPPLRLKDLDDSMSIRPNSTDQLYDHRGRFRLYPGDRVAALGCYSCAQMGFMIVSGIFRTTPVEFRCENLLHAECIIASASIGGPLINRYGEVIGINFFSNVFTPFLPINIVSLWWLNVKKNGHCVIPRLGLNLKNMSLCRPRHLELVLLAFPNTSRGVVVDEDQLESIEASTKILKSDIIIECDGKPVGGTLEFLELIWDKAGESVRLTLLRPSDGCRLNVTVTVGNVDPSQLNGSVNLILEEKRVTMGRVFGAEVEYNKKMAEAEISSVNKNY
ncbi:hypothetical protein OROGR_000713 [Orobanche gracilis]